MAVTGPLTGTGVPTSGRHHVAARSPLTGFFGESNVGGSWAVHFKKAGFDGIVVKGKTENPVYLWIHEGKAEIRDARPIWGKDSYESADWLKKETVKEATAAVIGPAGERMAKIAGIPHIGHIVRAAARTGLGAVMGSKNLKAMVAYGDGSVPIAKPDELKAHIKNLVPHIQKATESFGKFGTSGGIDNYEKMGNFPLKNWKLGRWEGAKKISGVTMHDTILSGRKACLNCPIACGRHIKVTEGSYAPMDCEGPEYETIGTLGGLCLVDDLIAISKANELCNRYGLDTISTGGIVAFAMEAYEKGLIGKEDTGGVELKWGDEQAMIAMVHQIGKREKLGALLGQGVKRAAEKLGGDSWKYAVHVKGMETPMHDPRTFYSIGLTYAVGPRGACHLHGHAPLWEGVQDPLPEWGLKGTYPHFVSEGKGNLVKLSQDYTAVVNSMVSCYFVTFILKPSDLAAVLAAATGTKYTAKSLLKVGERIMALHRAYNNLCGVTRKDDVLAPRALEPTKEGGNAGKVPDMEVMIKEFYKASGWTTSGRPSRKTLESLGLQDVARDLYGPKRK